MKKRAEFPGAVAGRAWHDGALPGLVSHPGSLSWMAHSVTAPSSAPDWPSRILAIAARNDRDAFAALFGHFAPRLKSFFLRSGASDGLAEDLAQETMLMVWRKAALFDPERAQVSTWIFTIARNLRIDAKRRERDPQAVAEFFESAPEPLPSEHLLSAERCQQVHRAIRELTPDQAEAIRLSFFEDRPHSEIATSLGLPLGTVKSRVRLAMARLRALVEDAQ
jgi:RNA polymerase sigma-70 factor (ECF subfamily)